MEIAEPDKQKLCDDWHRVLNTAAREVLFLMTGVAPENPPEMNPAKPNEVVAMVGLAGELCGVLTVRCSQRSAVKMACRMLGVSEFDAVAQAGDAVGEVCNVVAGSFKARIELEDKCMLSVPTVIMGSNYELHSLVAGQKIELPLLFQGDAVWFSLQIRM